MRFAWEMRFAVEAGGDRAQPRGRGAAIANAGSSYSLVKAKKPYFFKTTCKKFDFPEAVDGAQCFRWVPVKELSKDEFTFPIDKFIVNTLKKDFGS